MNWGLQRLVGIFVLVCLLEHSLLAHRQPCPDALKIISIDQLIPTQKGTRRPHHQLEARRVYIRQKNRLPKPAILFQTPDGRLFIRDGHHDIELARQAGLTTLNHHQGDFIFEVWSHEEFQEINLAAGWVTPMELGVDFRRPELAGWKRLLQSLRDHWSPTQIEAFIRRHPEAYLVPRSHHGQAETPLSHLSSRDPEEYQEYLRKMDLTMPMKIGQLLPAFPSDGILIDNGFGTGQQSFAYALYNPNLLVVGQDIALDAVNHAASQFQLSNLVFLQGNVLESQWPENFADAVVESSFSHEVFSYGHPVLDIRRVESMRAQAFRQLKEGGTYGFRDFVRPNWPETVVIELPTAPRQGVPPYGHLSLSDLFEDYAKTHINRSFRYEEIDSGRPGFRAFRTSGTHAANFLLRVNYTNKTSWESERREQYIYSSQQENIDSFRRTGFRVDYAAPVENHWMIRNWWEKEGIRVLDLNGHPLPWPPSNFVLYATKPFAGDPVSISIQSDIRLETPEWMKRRSFESSAGQRLDMIQVPGKTKLFLPYEKNENGLFLWVRRSMPLYGQYYYAQLSRINQAYYQGFGSGPIARLFQVETPPQEAFSSALLQKVGGHVDPITLGRLPIWQSGSYLTSPGGTDETVTNVFIDVQEKSDIIFDPLRREMKRVKLEQLLAAAHLGAINDPRLELGAYALGIREGAVFFPWIGPKLTPTSQPTYPSVTLGDYPSLGASTQKVFTEVSEPTNFMGVRRVVFQKERVDRSFSTTTMEFIVPTSRSVDTFSVVPYANAHGEILVGLEQRSLPSFEQAGFGAQVAVIPAWRISQEATSVEQARTELTNRMLNDFNLHARDILPLGEGYFASSGQTPEKIQPHAVEVDLSQGPKDLVFIPLKNLLANIEQIPDLHTRIGVYRLAHALGLL